MSVLYSYSNHKAERMRCVFLGSVLEIKNEINKIFRDETNNVFKFEKMKKVFNEYNICAIYKKKEHQKPCCKNKI